MYLLIPGRHQLLTQFQFRYIQRLIQNGLNQEKDVFGNSIGITQPIKAVLFAVTSANHSNTRRNPLPFYLRAIAIEDFGNTLGVPTYIYGIDDVGQVPNFAGYTLKRIQHDSEGLFHCTPANTVVICSTPVLNMYHQLGFTILPAELQDLTTWQHHTPMPWDLVEHIAKSTEWENDPFVQTHMHTSAYNVWRKYRRGEKVQMLFRDVMISSDGDLTETRDYNVYVRQMDDIAEMKYHDTASFIQPGRIGDIGCAVGSWIKLACKDERLRESDFYGIEVSRYLYVLCQQRKENGEFINPFVFFSQKNAVTGLVFEPNSMNTIHTSSLTHEIESYGSRNDLLQFIQNRYEELAPGGVWINRDVVGPENKDQIIHLWLNDADGSNEDPFATCTDKQAFSQYLSGLSTHARFLRFARDFRQKEGYVLKYSTTTIHNKKYIITSLRDAMEFLSRKDYTDNWQSEMHETFCFWDLSEWKINLQKAGFTIHTDSKAFTNEWIVANRWKGKCELFTLNNGQLEPLNYPVTTMFLIGVKA
ncbi:transferase [Longitalea luteola]|uniref:transferase n=1 Tax=Longitalea luteola TaxID=2812563 RepID=UPI001A979582|nr:transferase [Longitalea luteola]